MAALLPVEEDTALYMNGLKGEVLLGSRVNLSKASGQSQVSSNIS